MGTKMKFDPARSHPISGLPQPVTGACSPKRRMTTAIVFSATVFFLILAVAVITNRALFADGSYYLLMAANTGTIFHPSLEGSQRICAHEITQALVVLSLKLGVRDLQTLGLVFSLNQYL